MTVSVPDRLQTLLDQDKMTGMDFVHVSTDQVRLTVHFHKAPGKLTPPLDGITLDKVQILPAEDNGNGRIVPAVTGMRWDQPFMPHLRKVLHLQTETIGDYSPYLLRIDHPQIDPYFNNVKFCFKANCPSEIDCRLRPHECPPEEYIDFPIDYQARDFWSLRRALMEFASQRYPDWQDRGREADLGVMLAEVMSALGDEFAYCQDRIAREAYLETATQRRSLRHHARLVDYTVHDGLGARAWLEVTVKTGQAGAIPAGLDVWAVSENVGKIYFEVGRDLRDILNKSSYRVDWRRNTFHPHIWDEDDWCLSVGTTELFIKGHQKEVLRLAEQVEGGERGIWMVLRTRPDNPAIPARDWMVWINEEEIEELEDPLFSEDITRLVWRDEQALPFELDLNYLEVHGNLVPAVAGKTKVKRFVIGKLGEKLGVPTDDSRDIDTAIERTGPNSTVAFLCSLPGTETDGLVWLGDEPRYARPEIVLAEEAFDKDAGQWTSKIDLDEPCSAGTDEWCWRRSLIGVRSSQPADRDFMLEDGQWGRVVGYQRVGEEIVHIDYRSDAGATIRFGDGEFGLIPAQGAVFKATYRLGNGRQFNVAADTLTSFESDYEVLGSAANAGELIVAVTNPVPADGGLDPETPEQIRQLAPEAFRAETYRAVTERDYADAAERLPWVQRAGARFRWTGSWLSAFVTPDPLGAVELATWQRRDLTDQLDRFRQTGREVHVMDPRYADLDLEIAVCVEPTAYRGQVKEHVLDRLFGTGGPLPRSGFFSPDNFTFGTALERSVLEAAIHDVPGVRAVGDMTIARREWFERRPFTDTVYPVADNEVVRVENDPNHPDRGSVTLFMEGGA